MEVLENIEMMEMLENNGNYILHIMPFGRHLPHMVHRSAICAQRSTRISYVFLTTTKARHALVSYWSECCTDFYRFGTLVGRSDIRIGARFGISLAPFGFN
jgi:hypothetical protein